MAISTYTDLQSAIAGWLVRSDLTARIPDFIFLAEAHFNMKLRVRQMQARDTAPLAAGTEYGTVPTDYLEAITFDVSDGTTHWWMEPKPDQVIDEARDRTGRPRFYAEVGNSFRFYPVPNANYTAELTYYAQIPALTVANPTNWLLTMAPQAYLAGALLEAAPLLRDQDSLAIWEGKRDQALEAVRRATRTKAGRLRTDIPTGYQNRRHGFSIYDGC